MYVGVVTAAKIPAHPPDRLVERVPFVTISPPWGSLSEYPSSSRATANLCMDPQLY